MDRVKDFFGSMMLTELIKGMALTGKYMFSRKITVQYPEEKTPMSPRFRGLHRAAPLSERRRALHRLQAVRGGVPGIGDHDRVRRTPGRFAPHHALRHRPDQVHLLRFLRGVLPGRFDRRDPRAGIHGEKRGDCTTRKRCCLRSRPLRERDRSRPRGRRSVPLITVGLWVSHGI